MQVGLDELIDAFARSTKMKRAPAGASSTGLHIGALVPAVGGMRVEMPGGAHFVWITKGTLTEEVEFKVKPIASTLKVLRSLQGKETNVDIIIDRKMINFTCGKTKFSFARN